MSGDDRHFYPDNPEDGDPDDEHIEPPASVVFMEMMRQAAGREDYPSEGDIDPEIYATLQAQYSGQFDAQLEEERQRKAAALEAQRVRRIQRRQERRRRQTVGIVGGLMRSLILVVVSGGLIATILSWWTSPEALDAQLRVELQQANATPLPAMLPTLAPTPNWLKRIGIVSGHRGPEKDPGAVCPDGLTENEINYAVAERVIILLRARGYSVDLLEEFDVQLQDYRAEALISIHANDCSDYGEVVSGYLVSQAEARPEGGEDTRLRECVASHYETVTGLQRRFGLTRDMTDYHIFREISNSTPGIIIELGFMRADREILTTQPELLARGIVNGILCFLEPESDTLPAGADGT